MAKYIPLIVSAVLGAAAWIGIGQLSGIEEAWDSPLYWKLGLPALAVGIFLVAVVWPTNPWRWGFTAAIAQAVVGLAQAFPNINLWPLSLVFFGVLSLPLIMAAYFGLFVRRQVIGR